MKFTAERDALHAAVAQVVQVVERRNSIPILANLLVEAADGKLKITGTDLEIWATVMLDARVDRAGGTTLPAFTLHDALREMSAGSQVEVEIASGESRAQLASGRARMRLHQLPSADFPMPKAEEGEIHFRMDGKALVRCLGHVTRFQSTEEARYYLNGVHLEARDGELLFVTTNGHGLAFSSVALPDGVDEESFPDTILPTKLATLFGKMAGEREVRVGIAARNATLEAGDLIVRGKLIDGQFPDWRRVVPRVNDKRLCVTASALAGALRRVTVVAQDKERRVKLACDKDKLTLSKSSAESGEASEEVPAAYDGAPIEVGFNARYLLDIVDSAGAESLEVELADDRAPTLFTDPANASASWVMMPLRI